MDWSEEWRERYSRAMEVRGRGNYYGDAERARKYSRMEHLRRDGEARVMDLPLNPSWTVIDVGPGPGTMTIPLARRCSMVTAVEPSPHMIHHLRERASGEGLSNIRVVEARWEDVEGLERHDVLVASFCLTMPDIEHAIRKMNALAREHVYIYWFAGTTYWERVRMDLYPLIHGRPHVPGPKIDVLYNVLYGLGIYPDVKMLGQGGTAERSMNAEQAIDDLRDLMELPDRSHDNLLEDYVKENYRREGDEFIRPDPTVRARVSWSPVPL